MNWLDTFREYIRDTAKFWFGEGLGRYAFSYEAERQAIRRKKQQLKDRGAQIVKTIVDGEIYGQQLYDDERKVTYGLHTQHLIKQANTFYIEELIETRMALFRNKAFVSDEPAKISREPLEWKENEETTRHGRKLKFHYERLQAVRYADRWWNGHNPQYKAFDVDCTNYVSQCLHAGGAPMRGFSNPSEGWWYSGKSWSYSWAVAHSLRWYLPASTVGLRAKEMASADQLIPGDVICYDFEGDGRWDHTTIVTGQDAKGMPLVNAHTSNCRKRYWAYEDSLAWTENIQYKFFRIVDTD
ncbi:MAG TPA: amidase domain-containing protein [Bacillales bacterium]|nr:amidase domain-containing protein [Bacillales bacterium]